MCFYKKNLYQTKLPVEDLFAIRTESETDAIVIECILAYA